MTAAPAAPIAVTGLLGPPAELVTAATAAAHVAPIAVAGLLGPPGGVAAPSEPGSRR